MALIAANIIVILVVCASCVPSDYEDQEEEEDYSINSKRQALASPKPSKVDASKLQDARKSVG